MSSEVDIRAALRALLESQRFAALATDDHGRPFVSLMAFAATEDLKHLVILTERTTRKYANLQSNPRVTLLIDDHENRGSDKQDSVVVTAIGQPRSWTLTSARAVRGLRTPPNERSTGWAVRAALSRRWRPS